MWICSILICLALLARASFQQDAYVMTSLGDHGDRITDLESAVKKIKTDFGGLSQEMATVKEENEKLKAELKVLTDVCSTSQCCHCSNQGNTLNVSASTLRFSQFTSATATTTDTTTTAPSYTPSLTGNVTTVKPVTTNGYSSANTSHMTNPLTSTNINTFTTTAQAISTNNPSSTTNSKFTATTSFGTVHPMKTITQHTDNITSVKQQTTTAASTAIVSTTSLPVPLSTATTAKPAYDDCVAASRNGEEGVVSIKLGKNGLIQMISMEESTGSKWVNLGFELGTTGHTVRAYCDKDGWLVIQRRQTGDQDFNQGWNTYKKGFGDLTQDFWFGNDNIYFLTSSGDYTLRIDMEDWAQNKKFAEYGHFRIANEINYYRLFAGSYSGTAGDSFHYPQSYQLMHFQQPFSTPDRDNDRSSINCAGQLYSGWWFNDCYSSNLNGRYMQHPYGQRHLGEIYGQPTLEGTGIEWYPLKQRQYSLRHVIMKIKPHQVSGPMG